MFHQFSTTVKAFLIFTCALYCLLVLVVFATYRNQRAVCSFLKTFRPLLPSTCIYNTCISVCTRSNIYSRTLGIFKFTVGRSRHCRLIGPDRNRWDSPARPPPGRPTWPHLGHVVVVNAGTPAQRGGKTARETRAVGGGKRWKLSWKARTRGTRRATLKPFTSTERLRWRRGITSWWWERFRFYFF